MADQGAGQPSIGAAGGSLWFGILVLLALIGGFGLWAVVSKLEGAVIASGQIEVEQSRQVVQHLDGGIVAEIGVREGEMVTAGQVVLRLDGLALSSERKLVEGQLYEVTARQARLEAERDQAEEMLLPELLRLVVETEPAVFDLWEGQRRLFEARRLTQAQLQAQYQRRSAQIFNQIEGIDAQSTSLAEQLALIEHELATQQGLLDKGLSQVGRVLALQREAASMRGRLGELSAARGSALERITEFEIELSGREALLREEASAQLRDLSARGSELQERARALAERIARLDVVAPVSGVVLGLQVTTPRAVVRAAEPILYLIPQDRPLVISARISPMQIDQIWAGQSAKLVFSAFSTKTTPELSAQLARVSPDALRDPVTGQPFYRAELVPDASQWAKLAGHKLLPGMPVEVFIRTEERSPLSYLLRPFGDYFARAMRES